MLIELTKIIELKIGHDMLNSLQKLAKLRDKVVLMNRVVDQVLTSAIPKPVDIKLIVQ